MRISDWSSDVCSSDLCWRKRMPDNLVIGTSFAAAFGAALVGGVFFGFSNFVMAGLGRTPPEQGVAAMNSPTIGDQPGLHDRIVRHRPALSDRRRAVAGFARHARRQYCPRLRQSVLKGK